MVRRTHGLFDLIEKQINLWFKTKVVVSKFKSNSNIHSRMFLSCVH